MTADGRFKQRYGPWALVAGGSQGLGAALAAELAARGLDLLLVARGAEALARTAARLRDTYGVRVEAVPLDLAGPGLVPALRQAAGGREIGLLACNAAAAYTGEFLRSSAEDSRLILDTNCRASLELLHWLAPAMAERHRGGILIVTSLAGFQGSPLLAVYGASKAFLLTLGEALGRELGPQGVDVLVCAAGATRTPNYLAGKPRDRGRTAVEMEPAEVAHAALRALGRRPLVVAGGVNRFARFLMGRLLPRRAAVALMHRNTRALYGGGSKS